MKRAKDKSKRMTAVAGVTVRGPYFTALPCGCTVDEIDQVWSPCGAIAAVHARARHRCARTRDVPLGPVDTTLRRRYDAAGQSIVGRVPQPARTARPPRQAGNATPDQARIMTRSLPALVTRSGKPAHCAAEWALAWLEEADPHDVLNFAQWAAAVIDQGAIEDYLAREMTEDGYYPCVECGGHNISCGTCLDCAARDNPWCCPMCGYDYLTPEDADEDGCIACPNCDYDGITAEVRATWPAQPDGY